MTKQIKTFGVLAVLALAAVALLGLSAFKEQPKADSPKRANTIRPQWLPNTFTINKTPGTVSNPKVKMDSHGNITAAWIENNQTFTNYRPIGTNFNTENSKQVSQTSDGSISKLRLATNASGESLTTWTSKQGNDQQAMFSTGKNGKWSTPKPVPYTKTTSPNGNLEYYTAISNKGDFAIMSKITQADSRQSLNISVSNGMSFTNWQLRSSTTTDTLDRFALAAGPDNLFVPIWTEKKGTKTTAIMATFGTRTNFKTNDIEVTTIPTNQSITSISAATDNQHRITIGWTADGTKSGKYQSYVNAATAPHLNNTTSFSPRSIFAGEGDPRSLSLAADHSGRLIATWAQESTVKVAFSNSDSTFNPALTQTFQANGTPSLALNGQGDAILTFPSSEGTPAIQDIQATTRIAGEQFDTKTTQLAQSSQLNSRYVAPTAAIDSHGNSIVLWNESNTAINGRGYLATAPNFTELTVPTTSEINRPVTLIAHTTQVWPTGATTVKWDFGDNTPAATGTNVTHTYRQTGAHTVTTTATDAFGNSTEKSAKIQIENQPTPQPPNTTPTTPSNEHNTPQNELQVTIKYGKAGIFTNAVRVTKTGLANVKVACETKTTGCVGIIDLQTKTTQRPKRKGQKPTTKTTGIGRSAFKTPAGKTETLRIRISKPALRLLRTKKKLLTEAIIKTAEHTSTKKITLFAPSKPKKR